MIVQPPGPALARMLPEHLDPSHPEHLLFDDLIHVPTAAAEHRALERVLARAATVHHFETLLAEALVSPDARRDAIEQTARLEGLSDRRQAQLEELDGSTLAATLITGTLGGQVDGEPLLTPLVNLIFTRDLLALARSLVIVSNASKRARRRETLLAWTVVSHHPLFAGLRISPHCRRVRDEGGSYPLTVEGGDILIASEDVVLIGASERTTWSATVWLAEELLDEGFRRVIVVELPKQRSSMHLDTVFTFVAPEEVMVYRPILVRGHPEECRVGVFEAGCDGPLHLRAHPGHLLAALADAGLDLQPIYCGRGHPIHERREQWTDGANYVALAPGIVVGYGRNTYTAEAMRSAGYRVVDERGFVELVDGVWGGDFEALVASGEKVAVHLRSSELCRGRGGPRCLTLPLARDPWPAA